MSLNFVFLFKSVEFEGLINISITSQAIVLKIRTIFINSTSNVALIKIIIMCTIWIVNLEYDSKVYWTLFSFTQSYDINIDFFIVEIVNHKRIY